MSLIDYKVPDGHRLLVLSHSEIELIQKALNNAYFDKMELARKVKRSLERDAAKVIEANGECYQQLYSEIENGEKDA